MLSGHTDVVPVDGQPWTTNPFEATWVGDRLHGRGVADMKSFCATGLAFVPEFLRRGLARPLHIALSYDEEVGCIGVRRMIDDIARRGVTPFGCIVGEPTGMRTAVAHKGKRSWRCRVRGFEAHSSLTPLGVNAVEIACEIVAYLANMARAFRDQGPFDRAYDVAWTTVHTGVIHGGTALNIVPRDCSFDFEIRHLPQDDPELLFDGDPGIRRAVPAGDAQGRREHVHRVRRAVGHARLRHAAATPPSPACRDFAAARSATARSRSAPRRRCSTGRASRRSCADPGTSRRRTSRTNGSRASSSSAAKHFVRRLGDELCVD